MAEDLITLSIVGNGMPELHLLAQEMKKVKQSETRVAVLKETAKKLKKRMEKVLELASKANLTLLEKVVHMQYENYLIFYAYVQQLPKKMTNQKAAKLMMMYQVMNIDDLTQLVGDYEYLQKDINKKFREDTRKRHPEDSHLIAPVKQLSELYADDQDLQDFVDRSYGDEDNQNPKENSFEKILREKYVWVDGAGWVPKSMMQSPIHIVGENKTEKKKKK